MRHISASRKTTFRLSKTHRPSDRNPLLHNPAKGWCGQLLYQMFGHVGILQSGDGLRLEGVYIWSASAARTWQSFHLPAGEHEGGLKLLLSANKEPRGGRDGVLKRGWRICCLMCCPYVKIVPTSCEHFRDDVRLVFNLINRAFECSKRVSVGDDSALWAVQEYTHLLRRQLKSADELWWWWISRRSEVRGSRETSNHLRMTPPQQKRLISKSSTLAILRVGSRHLWSWRSLIHSGSA